MKEGRKSEYPQKTSNDQPKDSIVLNIHCIFFALTKILLGMCIFGFEITEMLRIINITYIMQSLLKKVC